MQLSIPSKIASQLMAKTRTQGKIVFVSSVVGYMSMFGYSTYTPGKHAIRGLSDRSSFISGNI